MSLQKGKILIAEPSIIGDVSFNRSIILLADHSTEGSIGFILNKPLDYNLGDLIPEINSTFKVYNGGPVQQDNLYFIHKVPELIPGSIEISQGLFWSGDFKHISDLIAKQKIDENDIISIGGNDVRSIVEDNTGKLWIRTFGRELNLFNPEDKKFTRYYFRQNCRQHF